MTCARNCSCRGDKPAPSIPDESVPLGERLKAAAKDWSGVLVLGLVLALLILV